MTFWCTPYSLHNWRYVLCCTMIDKGKLNNYVPSLSWLSQLKQEQVLFILLKKLANEKYQPKLFCTFIFLRHEESHYFCGHFGAYKTHQNLHTFLTTPLETQHLFHDIFYFRKIMFCQLLHCIVKNNSFAFKWKKKSCEIDKKKSFWMPIRKVLKWWILLSALFENSLSE